MSQIFRIEGIVFDREKAVILLMKTVKHCILLLAATLSVSCSPVKYIHDPASIERQKELADSRTASIITDGLMASVTILSGAVFEAETEWNLSETRFKKMNLQNITSDTLYVNMLTDVSQDAGDYCDFMDIRIPPRKSCRILCPVNAEYNIYYSNTPQEDDDEMITVNTSEKHKLKLKPLPALSDRP